MNPLSKLVAKGVPIQSENVDTDQILPGRFLSYPRQAGYGQFLFHDLRYDEAGQAKRDFILNQPLYRDARIIVGNSNFGCGSSREGAVYALYDYGIRAIIAPSFGDIFFNNCFRNGIIPIRLSVESCTHLRNLVVEQPEKDLTVDLEALIVTDGKGNEYEFHIEEFFRVMLLRGQDELGLTLDSLDQIEAYEEAYFVSYPWIRI